MSALLIALHTVAAIALIGPVMVATSMFPPRIVSAAETGVAPLRTLLGISRTYGLFSALVPMLGLAVFVFDFQTYARQGQFHAAIVLAIIAWALLLFVIVPKQEAVVKALESNDSSVDVSAARGKLAMFSGIFNLLWVVCAVLMFI